MTPEQLPYKKDLGVTCGREIQSSKNFLNKSRAIQGFNVLCNIYLL